jgi:hypothetical protein
MMKRLATIPLTQIVFLFLLSFAGCHSAPSGGSAQDARKLLLQSESALDAVHSFRMHVEWGDGLYVADSEFACDQDVVHYTTVQQMPKAPSLKVEAVQTAKYKFARPLEHEAGDWQRTGRQGLPPGICARLKSPGVQQYFTNQRFLADWEGSLPPFFALANEPGTTITHDGDESIDGVPCEVWTIARGNPNANPPQTVWIAVADRLPRKYVKGERANPLSVATYSDYGQPIQIQLPLSDAGY